MIYQCKNNEVVLIFRYTKNELRIDISKRKFIRGKTMKRYLNSFQTSSNTGVYNTTKFRARETSKTCEACSIVHWEWEGTCRKP